MSGSEYERGVLDNMDQGPFGKAIHGVLAGRYVIGKRDAERASRIAAFGAIRRAAEIARWYDERQKVLGHYDYVYELQAKTVRRAIRAAIGSEKT